MASITLVFLLILLIILSRFYSYSSGYNVLIRLFPWFNILLRWRTFFIITKRSAISLSGLDSYPRRPAY
jgi:hypothetical protein